MCLALPGRIVSITEPQSPAELRMGRVDFHGVIREVCLACVPAARVGDYVMVHAGLAIAVVDEAEAESVFTYLQEVELQHETG
jgi:hydrogenase expression/formation protein HypC